MAATPEGMMTQIMLGLGVVLLVLLVGAALYLVGTMRRLMKTADTVSRMAETTEKELAPILQGVTLGTLSIGQLLSRIDKIAAIFLSKFEILGEGADVMKNQATRFIHSPMAEIQSWMAGVRRGVEVFLGSKGHDGGGDGHG